MNNDELRLTRGKINECVSDIYKNYLYGLVDKENSQKITKCLLESMDICDKIIHNEVNKNV